MGTFVKHPDAELEYAFDWASAAAPPGDVVESSWEVAPDGTGAPMVIAQAVRTTRTVATVAGGEAGRVYRLTNRVRYAGGERDARTLVLRIAER